VSKFETPAHWLTCRASDLAILIRGVSYQKQDARNDAASGHKPILRANNINGVINLDDLVYVPASLVSDDQLLRAGDILFAMSSGSRHLVGKSARVNEDIDAGFGAFCGVLRPSPEVSSQFLFRVFQTRKFRNAISEVSKGSNINNLKREHLLDYEIPLPPLAEQKRIVAKIEELFSELEAGEESLRVARRQLGVYRQSLLKQAFEGKLTAQWRTQNRDKLGKPLTASTKLDVEPGPLPPGWIWQTVQEVADVTGGLTKNSKRDSLPQRIPYLRVANVYSNELRLDEIKDIGVTAAEADKVRLVKGDLLIVEGNGSLDQIGRVAAWNGSISDCGHQNHLIRARCHPNAHYTFVLRFLLSPHGRDVIEKQAASTSGLHTLSVSKVQRLPVPLCSLPEQQEIVRLLDEQFEVIERNERELDAALKRSEALRQAILKKAFTGRLVPQSPADEPASTLIARLRTERAAAPASKRKPTLQP
jgi:type I restriction enzyme S subunit